MRKVEELNSSPNQNLVPKCSLCKFSSAQLLIKPILEMIKCFHRCFVLSLFFSLFVLTFMFDTINDKQGKKKNDTANSIFASGHLCGVRSCRNSNLRLTLHCLLKLLFSYLQHNKIGFVFFSYLLF